MSELLSVNHTAPVGVPVVPVTVTLKVTAWPKMDDVAGDEVRWSKSKAVAETAETVGATVWA